MVNSPSGRNEYHRYLVGKGGGWGGKSGRCARLTTSPPSSAYCLEILGASTSWSPKGLSRPVKGCLYLYFTYFSCATLYFAGIWYVPGSNP